MRRHEDTKPARFMHPFRPPERAHQLAIRHHPSVMASEHVNELELEWRERHVLAVASDPPLRNVDQQPPERQPGAGPQRFRLAQHSPQAREQLIDTERPEHKIARARLQRTHPLTLVADRRQHQDPHPTQPPDLCAQLNASAVELREIDQQRIGRTHHHPREHIKPRPGSLDGVTGAPQDDLQTTTDPRFLVHDQHTRHARANRRRSRGCSREINIERGRHNRRPDSDPADDRSLLRSGSSAAAAAPSWLPRAPRSRGRYSGSAPSLSSTRRSATRRAETSPPARRRRSSVPITLLAASSSSRCDLTAALNPGGTARASRIARANPSATRSRLGRAVSVCARSARTGLARRLAPAASRRPGNPARHHEISARRTRCRQPTPRRSESGGSATRSRRERAISPWRPLGMIHATAPERLPASTNKTRPSTTNIAAPNGTLSCLMTSRDEHLRPKCSPSARQGDAKNPAVGVQISYRRLTRQRGHPTHPDPVAKCSMHPRSAPTRSRGTPLIGACSTASSRAGTGPCQSQPHAAHAVQSASTRHGSKLARSQDRLVEHAEPPPTRFTSAALSRRRERVARSRRGASHLSAPLRPGGAGRRAHTIARSQNPENPGIDHRNRSCVAARRDVAVGGPLNHRTVAEHPGEVGAAQCPDRRRSA